MIENIMLNIFNKSHADIFGYIGLLCFALSFLMQTTHKTFLMQAPADAAYGLHFLSLGSLSGCFVCLSAACRDIFASLAPQNIMRRALAVYLIIAWSVTFLGYESPVSLLPVIATSFATLSMLMRDNYYYSRALVYLVQLTWFSFFIIIGSVPGLLSAALIVSSNTIGLSRYYVNALKINSQALVK